MMFILKICLMLPIGGPICILNTQIPDIPCRSYLIAKLHNYTYENINKPLHSVKNQSIIIFTNDDNLCKFV